MADNFKHRKSIRRDDEILNDVKTWQVPSVEGEMIQQAEGYTNALGKKQGWVFEPPEEEPEPEPVKPLTIEDVESIRQAAYEEGFAEGKAEGFAKGEADGKESGYQAGYDEGQLKGHEAGLASGTSLMEEKAAHWNTIIEQLANPLSQLDQQVEKELVELTTALTKAVIQVEISTNPDVILNSIKQAAEHLPFNTQQCQILLNPEDYQLVYDSYGETELARRQWHILSEPSIARGGLEIKTELSSVSYQMDERIKEILEQFLQQSN